MNNNSDLNTNIQFVKKLPKKDHEIQTIYDVIEDLKHITDGFPHAAINYAVRNQKEITPILFEFLKESIEHHESITDEHFGHLHALYLLAYFRETQAFPLVMQIASLPDDWPENLLGETITEGLHQIIGSVYNGDLLAIQNIIENPKLNTWSRNAALKSLLVLVKANRIERNEVIDYFKKLFPHPSFINDMDATTHLVCAASNLYPEELYEEIKTAYQNQMVDEFYINLEDIDDTIAQGKEAVLDESLDDHYSFIDDPEEMKNWTCFSKKLDFKLEEEYYEDKYRKSKSLVNDNFFNDSYDEIPPPYERETPKIGRNDPCYCGSGKKYKKCCLTAE